MIKLSTWENGFSFAPDTDEDLRMYLWFYEWNLFNAFKDEQHSGGSHRPKSELVKCSPFVGQGREVR